MPNKTTLRRIQAINRCLCAGQTGSNGFTRVSYFKFHEDQGEPVYVSENVFTGEAAKMLNMSLEESVVPVRNGRALPISFAANGVQLVPFPQKWAILMTRTRWR